MLRDAARLALELLWAICIAGSLLVSAMALAI